MKVDLHLELFDGDHLLNLLLGVFGCPNDIVGGEKTWENENRKRFNRQQINAKRVKP